MQIRFRAATEEQPSQVWSACYARAWPGFLDWFLQQGDSARPSYLECRRAVREHVPELEPLWNDLIDIAGGGDQVARALSLWRPSPYMTGCSQAVWSRDDPFLVRNYDYHPDAFEGNVLRTRWLATSVLALTDCLWGVLDGVNEHGLCVALAFAGSRHVGRGFGVPLLLRYVLQRCQDLASAVEVLSRLPSHMKYHVMLLDALGSRGVVTLTPDKPAVFSPAVVVTNHGDTIEWPEHARATRSVERVQTLAKALGEAETGGSFIGRFLRPPVFQLEYRRGFGTLYTAVYRPSSRALELVWPDASWQLGIAAFEPGERLVTYPLRSRA